MTSSFALKRARIIEHLNVSEDSYSDRSPKGSIDEGIRTLVDDINQIDGLVTTSSCAGRISVYQEGEKRTHGDRHSRSLVGQGGKGGGQWLFVSHSPVSASASGSLHILFGLAEQSCNAGDPQSMNLIHLKFEPMVRRTLPSHKVGFTE